MKCLILAAGYATRLYPLTENFPKPLLEVNGKPIISWILDDIDANVDIEEYIVVTNHRFAEHFNEWKEKCGLHHPITVLDDGSTENDNRLGAVQDIVFAVNRLKIEDDLMVLAGDNLLNFSLKGFINYFKKVNHTCVMRHYESSVEKLRKTGVASMDDNGMITLMEEKPSEPKSNWAIPPFYIYSKEDLYLLNNAINDGCDTDAPGGFIAWLCTQCKVYAYEMPGRRYDIGDLNTYKAAQHEYNGITVM